MTPEQSVTRWRTRYDCIEELWVEHMRKIDPTKSVNQYRDEIREKCESFMKEKGLRYPFDPSEK